MIKIDYSVLKNKHIVPDRNVTIDITETVKFILGPAEDCYGQDIYPTDLGFSSLIFEVLTADFSSAKFVTVRSTQKLQE